MIITHEAATYGCDHIVLWMNMWPEGGKLNVYSCWQLSEHKSALNFSFGGLASPSAGILPSHRMGSPRAFDRQITERSSESSLILDATVTSL